MLNNYLLFKCTSLFFLYLSVSFSIVVINKWASTVAYISTICIHPTDPIIKMSGKYYTGTIKAYYITNHTDNLLKPVTLYYPPMYTIFTHTSKQEVLDWFERIYNITSEKDIIRCLVDTDKRIGIIDVYMYIADWVFLLLLSLALIVWIAVSLKKQHTPDVINYASITETDEIPPVYIEEDPELPIYIDNRTPHPIIEL